MSRRKSVSVVDPCAPIAHRGYLIRPRIDSGFSITSGVHVIQHQTESVDSAKAIIDSLLD